MQPLPDVRLQPLTILVDESARHAHRRTRDGWFRILLAVALAATIACDGPSSVPPPPPPPPPLTATLISPSSGPADLLTEIEVYGQRVPAGRDPDMGRSHREQQDHHEHDHRGDGPVHAPGTVSLVVTNPDGRTATAGRAYTYVPPTFAVTEVAPAVGMTGDLIEIAGVGFHAGAAVTFDGVPVVGRLWVSSSILRAVVPFHADGPVDVVVTNPGSQSRRLSARVHLRTGDPDCELRHCHAGRDARGELGGSQRPGLGLDWALQIEDGNEVEGAIWWQDIYGATSGTLTLPAPAQPGRYEFRYFGSHHRSDHKRSATVTVTAQQSGATR